MSRLLLLLTVLYLASLAALLGVGLVPGVPWEMLVSFLVHSVPLALTLAWALTRLEKKVLGRGRWLVQPLGVAVGLALIWYFNWTAHPAVIVALVLFSVWQLVVGSARAFWKPLGLSIAILLLGYGTVWNINYLAGHALADTALRDQALLDFDLGVYREWAGESERGSAGIFPVVRNPIGLRFLEHAYMYYYEEIFLVLFVVLFRGAGQDSSGQSNRRSGMPAPRLGRFFSVMFASFLIGIPIFLVYPTIGPFTYVVETIDVTGSSTFQLMSGVLRDWDALHGGGTLGGYGYFIAMPSMHVAVAVILQAFAWSCRPLFWLLVPVNVLLFFSTFLLGWHYILDAPAGLIVGGLTLLGAKVIDRFLRGRAERTLAISPALAQTGPQPS